MKTFVQIALLLAINLAYAEEKTAKPVDQSFTRSVDFTGDGTSEVITVRVRGRSLSAPLRWSLTVRSGTAILYRFVRDDADIDGFFNDDKYVGHCNDYVSCKRKYYFSDILEQAVDRTHRRTEDSDFVENFRQTAGAYLSQMGLREAKLEAALKEMNETLKNQTIPALIVMDSPVQAKPPMIWVRSIKRFVPYYQE